VIAAVALLAVLAAVDEAPATVWVVAEPAAEATIARVTNELRAIGCAVRSAPLDSSPAEVAEDLLGDLPARRLVVVVFASPVPMEVWWWRDAADAPEYELVRRAVTPDEERLDAIRVAEVVRARLALSVSVPPAAGPAPPAPTVAAAPAQADPPLVLRLAVGPTLSGHVEAQSAAGLALSIAVALSRRTAALLNVSLPLAAVEWQTWDATAWTRDYVIAALLERRLFLPLGFELRGAAGVSFHTRVSRGVTLTSPVAYQERSIAFTAGPVLAAAIAYRIRDTFGLVATAAVDATYPDQHVEVGHSEVYPGYFLWSLGLLAEVEF